MKKSHLPVLIRRIVPLSLSILAATVPAADAELLMLDRFDFTPDLHPEPTAGLYRELAPLISEMNQTISGGRMVGFSQDLPWSGSSQLPRVAPAQRGDADNGRVAFRGNTDDLDRVVFRRFQPETSHAVVYFGVTLETSVIDPEGLALVALAEPGRNSPEKGSAFLEGSGFTQGFAFGFRGDGRDGMDLVMRFRDEDVVDTERVLVENVKTGFPYEIVCRVEWDVIERGKSPRERVAVWVNPGAKAEETAPIELVATSGRPGLFGMLYLLQRRYGGDVHDAFYVDDVWLGTAFADRPGR